VREVLAASGMAAAVKTSGSKGVHVVVPLDVPADGATVLPGGTSWTEDVMAATRAVAARAERLDPVLATTAYIKADRGGKVFLDATRSGGATVVAAYSPRVRPGTTVSWPVRWEDLDRVLPRDATVRTARGLLAAPDADPWRDLLPAPQPLDPGLVEEGRTIPVARVAAMHEGKRRAKARREAMSPAGDAGPTPAGPTPSQE
jgi:DNA primase